MHACSKTPHEPPPRASVKTPDTTIPPRGDIPISRADTHYISQYRSNRTHWAYRCRSPFTLALVKVVVKNCPFWSQTKIWKAPQWGNVLLCDRPHSRRQIDFIGPLCPTVWLVGMQLPSFILLPHSWIVSSRNAASHHVNSFLIRYVLIFLGPPDVIDSVSGSHFTS